MKTLHYSINTFLPNMTKGLWFRQSQTKTSPSRQYTQITFKLQLPHHTRLTISVQTNPRTGPWFTFQWK